MTREEQGGCRCLLAARILCRDVAGDERKTLVELAARARDIDVDGLSGTVEIPIGSVPFGSLRPLIKREALVRISARSLGSIAYRIDVRAIPARRGVTA